MTGAEAVAETIKGGVTPGPWMVGRAAGTVVAAVSLRRAGDAAEVVPAIEAADRGDRRYYGGAPVAESASPSDAAAICLAPDLVDLLQSSAFVGMSMASGRLEVTLRAGMYEVMIARENPLLSVREAAALARAMGHDRVGFAQLRVWLGEVASWPAL